MCCCIFAGTKALAFALILVGKFFGVAAFNGTYFYAVELFPTVIRYNQES